MAIAAAKARKARDTRAPTRLDDPARLARRARVIGLVTGATKLYAVRAAAETVGRLEDAVIEAKARELGLPRLIVRRAVAEWFIQTGGQLGDWPTDWGTIESQALAMRQALRQRQVEQAQAAAERMQRQARETGWPADLPKSTGQALLEACEGTVTAALVAAAELTGTPVGELFTASSVTYWLSSDGELVGWHVALGDGIAVRGEEDRIVVEADRRANRAGIDRLVKAGARRWLIYWPSKAEPTGWWLADRGRLDWD